MIHNIYDDKREVGEAAFAKGLAGKRREFWRAFTLCPLPPPLADLL